MIEEETFRLLEWQRLCQHLSTFAATKLGVVASSHLTIPLSVADTEYLLAQTKEVCDIEMNINSNWSFNGIHDIGESIERAKIGGVLNGDELLNLATTLSGIRKLRRVIEEQENAPTLQELVNDLRTFPELEQEIHYCIDDRGEITERASPQLAEIRQKIKALRNKIQQTLQGIIQRNSNALQEPVVTQRGDRFVLPLKASHSGQIQGIVHDTSTSGVTLYLEPRVIIELGNKLQTSRNQEKREEEKILRQLTEKVAEVWQDLEQLLAIATSLDLATAKARYSIWLNGYPPEFVDFEDGESISLRQLRHPLLVWQEKQEDGKEVIPIDVLINPETRVVAITGPNTGGKTVTLKTIGIVALMAKVGLYIPAKYPAQIPWFKSILADIGDEQSLEQSLSTFSGHIRRIIRIIEALNVSLQPSFETELEFIPPQPPFERGETQSGFERGETQSGFERGETQSSFEKGETQSGGSLVLLDEVGAGTDPSEGTAIAIAILKYLAQHNLLTIATTHYGELKSLKYNDSRFENASVEFDDSTLQPTYRLLWGIPGRSNAITIAQRLGLPLAIVAESQELVGGFSQDVNDLISALENQRREQENKHQQAEELLSKTELFYQQVEEKAFSLQARERDLKLKQEQEVQKLLFDAKSQIAQVIKGLQKKGEPTAQDAHQATETLTKIADRFLNPVKVIKYKPKVGERVRILSIGQTAEVLTVDDDMEQLSARFGIMKMVIPFTDIESLDGKRFEKVKVIPEKTKVTVNKQGSPQDNVKKTESKTINIRTSQNTVDIRGKRVHLAEPMLEKAIANATDIGSLWIIHGKGTGSLRTGVHEFLKNHPQVSKFELAKQNDGGAGVTLVLLK
ncbi:MAG: endonuclease MutS2 [Cyanobacteria bacterium]|nr:endonuclease MutS2 [Cyanobacteria bacterium CG_2015-16_32_12]NCO77636.1 endonuclease MutS2 [Cyanobacteria bacterium CG_2015-22_32_23]NCS83482.1 endonuclease MutS2 [Cyanobacteria bacterium CG_2015-02_32_10]